MDLGRLLSVVWRFRLLLATGLLLAAVVALASMARISLVGVRPDLS